MKQIQIATAVKSQNILLVADLPNAVTFGIGFVQIEKTQYISDGIAWKINGIGQLLPGVFQPVTAMFRLALSGNGTVQITTKDITNAIVTNAFTISLTAATNELHSYLAELITEIKVTYTAGITVNLLG